MEWMRTWIFSVTVSAMLIAVAEGMMPGGAVKKAARLLGGLVLMLGMLQPIMRMDVDTLFAEANGLSEITVETKESLEESSDDMMKSIIEGELCAYVLDKAQDLGIACTVSIHCVAGENRAILPQSAEIRGLLTPAQKSSMQKLLKEDLGISRDDQIYVNEEVT